jgi:hypothetical protein
LLYQDFYGFRDVTVRLSTDDVSLCPAEISPCRAAIGGSGKID